MAVESIKMSVDQFIAIPENPRQRDTAMHASKAEKRHLKKLSPSHSCVAIASVNGVPICKLDGHTRAFLWKQNRLDRPSELLVSVFDVESIDEAKELYRHFDNSDAAEGSTDKLSGACREAGLQLNSQLLCRYTFNTSLKIAHELGWGCSINEYKLVPQWAKAIQVIDSWQLPRNPFKGSGILSLMFITVASQSIPHDSLQDFFSRYARDEGEKNGKLRDGVQALKEHLDQRRISNQMTGYDNIIDMMNKGYSCLRAWLSNAMISNVQPSRDALEKLHKKARTNIDAGKMRIE